jgi:anthranilate synthase component 2
MIVLIDNYDSFTYNLVQYFGDLGLDIAVHRNDKITPEQVVDLKPQGVVISPGPSDPDHAGICLEMIAVAAKENIPLLGVCLGHQCIGQAFGGRIVKAKPVHGKTSEIVHIGRSVFKGIQSPLEVTRYHSLIIERDTCPSELEITAQTSDGIIMGVKHETKPIHGVQFHPESIATTGGHQMLKNFVDLL